MLQQLLRIMAAGDTLSLRQMAKQLDASEELLVTMIGELVRMGYLEPVHDQCSRCCQSCSQVRSCGVGTGRGMWALNARGKKLALR